jgi:hypothetical protein
MHFINGSLHCPALTIQQVEEMIAENGKKKTIKF